MLIPNVVAQGIALGQVTQIYRRWDVPRAKAGGRQTTRFGVVGIDSVVEIANVDAITESDAVAAGERDLAALRKWLMKRPDHRIFRVGVHFAGPDPRLELRTALPDEAELAGIGAALDRMDGAKSTGPWTRLILHWIRDNPAIVSKELAKLLDRELQPMKTDIRKLKALGLTISLDVGYRLSPRGEAFLEWDAAR